MTKLGKGMLARLFAIKVSMCLKFCAVVAVVGLRHSGKLISFKVLINFIANLLKPSLGKYVLQTDFLS